MADRWKDRKKERQTKRKKNQQTGKRLNSKIGNSILINERTSDILNLFRAILVISSKTIYLKLLSGHTLISWFPDNAMSGNPL